MHARPERGVRSEGVCGLFSKQQCLSHHGEDIITLHMMLISISTRCSETDQSAGQHIGKAMCSVGSGSRWSLSITYIPCTVNSVATPSDSRQLPLGWCILPLSQKRRESLRLPNRAVGKVKQHKMRTTMPTTQKRIFVLPMIAP